MSPARSLTQILHIRKYDATTGGKGVIVEDCESWDQANKRVNQLRKEQPDAAFYVRRRISNAEKIEEQMLDAIRKEKDFNLRNTRVEVIDFPGLSKRVNVYLYSKCICKLTEDERG